MRAEKKLAKFPGDLSWLWIAVGGGMLAAGALAIAMSRRRSRRVSGEAPPHVKAAITVGGDPEVIHRSWLDMHGGDGMGTVRFVPAPGGRGTEIHVDAKADLSGDAVKDELRRFKQLLEIGEEVRS
jgi:hypothetical protein